MIHINAVLAIYISINLVVAGYYLRDDQFKLKGKIILFFILVVFGISFLIYDFISQMFKWLATFFQINFFYTYYFTKKYYNMEHESLERWNSVSNSYFNGTGLRHRIYRYCAKKVSKRNNYTWNNKINIS